jgi:hypothetical protein
LWRTQALVAWLARIICEALERIAHDLFDAGYFDCLERREFPARRFLGSTPLFCRMKSSRSFASLSGISTESMIRRMASSCRRR